MISQDKQEIISKLYANNILVTNEVLQLIQQGYTYEQIAHGKKEESPNHVSIEVTKTYKDKLKEFTVQDFTSHYLTRYKIVSNYLKNRQELTDVTSIRRLQTKNARETISVIAYVYKKQETKNGHLMLELEDQTGMCRAIVVNREENKEIFDQAKNIVVDQIIGISGSVSNGDDKLIFVDTIVEPDVPNVGPQKKCDDDVDVVFIGDLHFGSNVFLHEAWEKFIQWINDQKKVHYLIISGDIIEGVGIYPNQDKDLSIMAAKDQYDYAAEQFKRIRSDIKIITCPGNHDTMRLSEPQPALYKKYAKNLLSLPNITSVSSPSYVTIHKHGDFPGFLLLLYHGNSFFYYFNEVQSIRQGGGVDRPDLVMEYLLKQRHLAPSHSSTLFIPDPDRDELIIDKIPDFFITGHIHKQVAANYKSVTLLNCSCFVDITEYQKKQGMKPDLAKATVVNLKTRNITTVDFHDKKSE